MSSERLTNLLVKYANSENEEYRRAKRLVNERIRLQGLIKDEMKKLGITRFIVDTEECKAEILFSVSTQERVDVGLLPDEIKNTYIKYIEIWREFFTHS